MKYHNYQESSSLKNREEVMRSAWWGGGCSRVLSTLLFLVLDEGL